MRLIVVMLSRVHLLLLLLITISVRFNKFHRRRDLPFLRPGLWSLDLKLLICCDCNRLHQGIKLSKKISFR